MSGLCLLTLIAGLTPATQPVAVQMRGSYLYRPAYCLDEKLRLPTVPYDLQPGDICFAVNDHPVSKIGHYLSGAGMPNHSMIAFAMPGGRVGILEAAPHSKFVTQVIDGMQHLSSYQDEGSRVWVRRRKFPLTAEQSACLTKFCMAHDETRFASVRLVGQLTPFRSRGNLRTAWVGKPNLDKPAYFCSELVLNSLVAAHVLDPELLRPAATYPSDLFFNHSENRWVNRSLNQLDCEWEPPARWTACPSEVAKVNPTR